jgi:hypothetical protein
MENGQNISPNFLDIMGLLEISGKKILPCKAGRHKQFKEKEI